MSFNRGSRPSPLAEENNVAEALFASCCHPFFLKVRVLDYLSDCRKGLEMSISLVPRSNQDKGPPVKAVCTVGCIGCAGCSRRAEPMGMSGNLPQIDYDQYESADAFDEARAKCPGEAMIFVGKPTPEDLAAVADEELPGRVEADFKTTVDDTEWRG